MKPYKSAWKCLDVFFLEKKKNKQNKGPDIDFLWQPSKYISPQKLYIPGPPTEHGEEPAGSQPGSPAAVVSAVHSPGGRTVTNHGYPELTMAKENQGKVKTVKGTGRGTLPSHLFYPWLEITLSTFNP